MGQPSNTRKKQRKNYILDTNTRNISFIQTALDLSKLGIKNCGFFLKLYDISLVGVDPFSPTLTEEHIMRITTECVRNPWYFLRECVRIPEQGNPAGIPYLLNRANLAMTWCFLNGIDSYNVIPRQIGKTQGACAIIDWGFLLGTTNSEFSFNNMQYEKAVENLTRLKDQRDLLPSYLQFKVAYNEEGKLVELGTVSSGITDEMRRQMTETPENYVGHVCSLDCMSIDRKEKTLRHPVFKCMRDDKNPHECLINEVF